MDAHNKLLPYYAYFEVYIFIHGLYSMVLDDLQFKKLFIFIIICLYALVRLSKKVQFSSVECREQMGVRLFLSQKQTVSIVLLFFFFGEIKQN